MTKASTNNRKATRKPGSGRASGATHEAASSVPPIKAPRVNVRSQPATGRGAALRAKRLAGSTARAQSIERDMTQRTSELRTLMFELELVPALEWLAEEIQRIYGTVINVRDDGRAKPLDHRVSSVLFRAVSKHAKVGVAGVEITCSGDQICIVVTDQGVGFDLSNAGASRASKGFGLLSIRERIGHIGGDMNAYSAAEGGTSVTLSAPLFAPDRDSEAATR
jgi:signal transduction histidine kinase